MQNFLLLHRSRGSSRPVEGRIRFAPSGHEDHSTSQMILFAGERRTGVVDDDYYRITDPEARHDV
jgi:hypothetical protein